MSKRTSRKQSGLAWALRAPLALVMEPRHTGLSLGRCSMVALTSAVVWLILRHPHLLIGLGWPPAFLLATLYLVLAAYCWGTKPAVQDLLVALAARMPNSGPVGVLPLRGAVAAPPADDLTPTVSLPPGV